MQKIAGITIYIDDAACDKNVQSVVIQQDQPTVVSLLVSCPDKKVEKGQQITIRSYYQWEFLEGVNADSSSLNWVHIKASNSVP